MNELEAYEVNDLAPQGDELCVVLLLESPFESEVLHKHPLAGASGLSVTKWLIDAIKAEFGDWNPDIPFGCHLRRRNYGKIGLMNCSQYPMDKSVYRCSDRLDHTERVIGMDVIRGNPKSKSRKDPKHTEIEREIVNDLALRLKKIPDSALIVPCGDVARTLVCKTQTPLTIYHEKVPHPSRSQWSAEGNQTVMAALAEELQQRLRRAQPRNCK
jgi:hypothetical protein